MDGTPIDPLASLLAERQWLGRLARGLTHDAATAEDLAQEAWLAAWRKGPEHARSWRAWLGETARRLAAGARRRESRRERRERAAARGEDEPGSDELVAKSELLEVVAREALALEEPFRRTLLLRFQEDLEPAAIAAREGLAPDTVRFRLRRGLELLRARLERRLGPEWRARVLWLLPASRVPLPPAAGTGVTVATAVGGLVVLKGFVVAMAMGILAVAYLGWRAPQGGERGERPREEAAPELAHSGPALDPRSEGQREEGRAAPPGGSALPSAPAPSATACRLTGRVVGEVGEPLLEVEVAAYRFGRRELLARTGPDGVFRAALEAPEEVQSLLVTPDPFHERRTLLLAGQDPNVAALAAGARDLGTLVLGATGAVVGQVLGADGAPVEKAFLVLNDYPGLGSPYAFSEASGEFLMGHVRAGTWPLSTHHLGYRIPQATVEVAPGETARLDVVLEPGPPVTGRVVDVDGAPVAGVEVQPCGYWYAWGVATDADGRFELSLASDEPCALTLSVEGYDVVSGLARAYAPGTRDIEIVLVRSEPVRFRVLDEHTLAPVELYGLAVEEEGESFTGVPWPSVHPGGECTADARPGETLHVRAPGYLNAEQEIELEPWGGVTVPLQRGATLFGRAVRDGRPVAGASVHLARRSGELHAPGEVAPGLFAERDTTDAALGRLDPDPPSYPGRAWRTLELVTGADGGFAFTGIDDQEWSLEVRTADGAGVTRTGLRAPAELGALELRSPVPLTGRVEFALPGGLAGHAVVLEGLPERRTTTDESGSFAFEGVAAGEHWLRVVPAVERVAPATAFFLRLAPEERREVTLRVEDWPAAHLGLTLLANGRPMVEPLLASFVLADERRLTLSLAPDAGGRVELALPALGPAWLELHTEGRIVRHPDPIALVSGALECRADFESGTLVLALGPEPVLRDGTRLELRVALEGAPGEPFALVSRVREGHVLGPRGRTLGPAAGPLSFEGLPAGRAHLELLADGRSLWSVLGVVPAGGVLEARQR